MASDLLLMAIISLSGPKMVIRRIFRAQLIRSACYLFLMQTTPDLLLTKWLMRLTQIIRRIFNVHVSKVLENKVLEPT